MAEDERIHFDVEEDGFAADLEDNRKALMAGADSDIEKEINEKNKNIFR